MQLSISGHHVDVTDALRDYANEKILRLERHNDHITNAHLVLTVEKQVQRAEATLHVVGGEVFADAEAPDLYAAIDLLFVLIVPPGETSAHLTTLAALARLFQSADNRAALRAGASDAELYDTFVSLVRTGST